jgi:hypothetical protein
VVKEANLMRNNTDKALQAFTDAKTFNGARDEISVDNFYGVFFARKESMKDNPDNLQQGWFNLDTKEVTK